MNKVLLALQTKNRRQFKFNLHYKYLAKILDYYQKYTCVGQWVFASQLPACVYVHVNARCRALCSYIDYNIITKR